MADRRRRLVVLGVMLSIFLAAMESTVVSTAMPRVVQYWISRLSRALAADVGPPCETTISGGRSPSSGAADGFRGA